MGLQAAEMDVTVPIKTAKTQHMSLTAWAVVFLLQSGTATSADLHGCAQFYALALG